MKPASDMMVLLVILSLWGATVSGGTVAKSVAANTNNQPPPLKESAELPLPPLLTATDSPFRTQAEVVVGKEQRVETQPTGRNSSLPSPHQRIVTNWDDMEKIWHHIKKRAIADEGVVRPVSILDNGLIPNAGALKIPDIFTSVVQTLKQPLNSVAGEGVARPVPILDKVIPNDGSLKVPGIFTSVVQTLKRPLNRITNNSGREGVNAELFRKRRSFDDNVWSEAYDRDLAVKQRTQRKGTNEFRRKGDLPAQLSANKTLQQSSSPFTRGRKIRSLNY